MRLNNGICARLVAVALLAGLSSTATAQLSNASTAATGLSGAFTARAQGYNAVAWNPANLAMPGNPGFSMTLMSLDGVTGLRPIDLSKVAEFQGEFLPADVREQWLLDVANNGGEKGDASGGLTEFGMSIGSLAFAVNTKVIVDANLAPDAVEAILFGNAGRTGTPKNLQLAGSAFSGSAYTTGAVSFGLPLAGLVPLSNFSAGATLKYTVGHAFAMGFDDGSAIDTDDLKVDFLGVISDSTALDDLNSGSGVGLDLGAAWTIPGFRFGASIQNLVNTFKWDTTKLATRGLTAQFSTDTSFSTVDSVDQAFSAAPAALREKVAALRFKPVLAAGVAFDWLPKMTVSADIRQQVGDGIEVGPKSTIAGGIEYRIIPFIPLRAGASIMTGGFGLSGGVALHFLGFEAGVAGFLRHRDGGTEPGATVNVFSIRP
jgi:hypothetical protein